MNGFVDFMFAQLWEYTKLTFRILRRLLGGTIWITALIRNRNQNIPKVAKTDLFDKHEK